jgi:hypothetical protein
VVEGSGEAGVVFCHLPTVAAGPVGKFLVTQMAAVAEQEADDQPAYARGVLTPASKAQWSPEQVRRLLARGEVRARRRDGVVSFRSHIPDSDDAYTSFIAFMTAEGV